MGPRQVCLCASGPRGEGAAVMGPRSWGAGGKRTESCDSENVDIPFCWGYLTRGVDVRETQQRQATYDRGRDKVAREQKKGW